ncbi:hypothetical protein ONZ45_g4295 [Pleurotus djamor]|nr:hypothetical protein ONZ45_g4295 [Pleurotus djamor]
MEIQLLNSESGVQYLPDDYYAPFLSDNAKNRKPSPRLISFLAGKPNASAFPFTSLSFTARDPFDPEKETALTVDGSALAEGLQYGATAGLKDLVDWINGLQENQHGRKQGEGWRVSIGSGSQDLIFKVTP